MNARQHSFLERYGERVSFDPTERRLYGHDIAAIPSLVVPLIGDTTPDAVVQPESEQELIDLASWAGDERVPLTPRGKASSGYGGAIPVRRGVVVDFYRMRRVLRVDPQNLTVTVQPGITWEQLDHLIKEHDLTLRLYPTSYPSSSVGGWLAQGGAGIGSSDANAVLVAMGVSLVMAIKLRLVCTYFLELHEAHPRIRRAVLAFCHGMPILEILTTAFGDTLSSLTGALLG